MVVYCVWSSSDIATLIAALAGVNVWRIWARFTFLTLTSLSRRPDGLLMIHGELELDDEGLGQSRNASVELGGGGPPKARGSLKGWSYLGSTTNGWPKFG